MGLPMHVRPDLFVQPFKTLVAMTSEEKDAQDEVRCAIVDLMLSLRSGSLALGPCIPSSRIRFSDISMAALTSQKTSEKCVHSISNAATHDVLGLNGSGITAETST